MKTNTRQRLGNLIMIIGAILILGAMALFAYNEYLNYNAGQRSNSIVSIIKKEAGITNNANSSHSENNDMLWEDSGDRTITVTPVPTMATINIDDHEYIGTIIIPDLNIELPVMSEWRDNYDDLKISPVRYSGSVYTNDMVIAGHNYRSHFNPLHNASVGMEVIFTDAYGTVYVYEIVELETIEPTDINGMIIFDSDLTLFTCTYGGAARHTVRCMRVN